MPAPKRNQNHLKHGLSHTRIDNIYKAMISRCYYKKNNRYERYGGRGITVCSEWKNDKIKFFEWAFSNGYSNELTLDRIDVNKGYCPENCRWVSYKKQANNKSSNRFINVNGVSHTIAEWSDITGISIGTIWARLQRGWSEKRAVEEKLLINRS